jgi:hypothetical protein
LTLARRRAHNDSVRRPLFALLCCLTAWAALPQFTLPAPDATVRMAAAAPGQAEAGVPEGGGESDRQWVAAHRVVVAGTESNWKTSAAHSGLAAAPTRDGFVTTRAIGRPDRSAQNRSPHRRHVPLLI